MAEQSLDYSSLSLTDLKTIFNQKKKLLKKNYKELAQKEKLIRDIRKVDRLNQKIKRGVNIKKKTKPKSFDDYFQECIKNKKIPADTPFYFRKALERAIKEHNQGLEKEKSALEDFASKYIIKGEPGITPLQFFQNKKIIIKNFFRNHINIKLKFVLVCMMGKLEANLQQRFEVQERAFFHSETYINLESTDVKDLLKKIIRNIIEKIKVYQQNGSGWYFKEVIQLEIHTVEFDPFKGSSYIALPDWIMRKKAIVSIRNRDDKCFLWSILRYLHPREKNDCRLADLKQYEHEIKIPKGFAFPVKTQDITKFENANPNLPGINVFSVNSNKKFYPLRLALRDPQNSIDLFLYEEDGKCHYSLIKNFSRLFRSQITTRTYEPIHICKRCLNGFTKDSILQKHIFYCNNETVYVKMPKSGSTLKFKNHFKQISIPFVAYADFECFTKPMNTCSPNPEDSYEYDYQKHEPSGFCIFIKGVVDKKNKANNLY